MEPRPSQQNLDEEQERQAKPKGLPSTLAWGPEVVEQLKEQEEAKHAPGILRWGQSRKTKRKRSNPLDGCL